MHTTDWSESARGGGTDEASFLLHTINDTASALAEAALENAKQRFTIQQPEWSGAGLGWMRSWLGQKQLRIPCVDVYVRL